MMERQTEKRKDAQIFVLAYKKPEYALPDDTLFTPLQVGTALRGEKLYEQRDDMTEDNISSQNYFYFETTGTYYVWRQLLTNPDWKSYRYIGQMQYRSWLPVAENTNFDELFEKVDFLAVPFVMGTTETLYHQYGKDHFIKPMDQVIKIIMRKFPEYEDATNKALGGNVLYYRAGFVMKREDFMEYAEFLFGVLNEFVRMNKIKSEQDLLDYTLEGLREKIPGFNPTLGKQADKFLHYQKAIGGFLAERLFTIFAVKRFHRRVKNMHYVMKESITGITSHDIKE